MTTESVNDRQVGGKHYKSNYQHWDFVEHLGLDYFEGCTTKYVTRRKNNRLEDLEKAKHFLLKRKELCFVFVHHSVGEAEYNMIESFALANRLSMREYLFLEAVCTKKYDNALKQLDYLISEV